MLLGYEELIIYRNFDPRGIIPVVCDAVRTMQAGEHVETHRDRLMGALAGLIGCCVERGLYGDLWAAYVADCLANHENAFSMGNEAGGTADAGVESLCLHDMAVIDRIVHADVSGLLGQMALEHLKVMLDYPRPDGSSTYEEHVREGISELARGLKQANGAGEVRDVLGGFISSYGAGCLGLHRAFMAERDSEGCLRIVPVLRMIRMTLDDLIGYEIPKARLVENTVSFLEKRPANNCLLYGDAGTGKSSCIRAIATQYYSRGLRVIQVGRDQYDLLGGLIAEIKNRNYRFIIYMDDLSFEEFETDYKYLKAVIEGGLEQRPSNVLIYATSNRRHLIRENSSDRNDRDEDMHRSDTMSEKLSLSQRFGVSIYFGSPGKKEYDAIVKALAEREGIDMPEDELLLEANKWELSHSGRSGRTARQFVDHLLGRPAWDSEEKE